MMSILLDRLRHLQAEMNQDSEIHSSYPEADRVMFAQSGGLFHLAFIGAPFDTPFSLFLSLLAEQEVANQVLTLSFSGPDVGANGTRNWDFTQLAKSSVVFPQLKAFTIERTKPEDHNYTIIAETYDEEGVIAKLIEKMPNIETLVVPSAPDGAFFSLERPSLVELCVDVGYNHQKFLVHFAQSTAFPQLRSFEYGDYCDTSIEDAKDWQTPFAHYQEFVYSKAFEPIRRFVLRNPSCSNEEITTLKRGRARTSFQVIRSTRTYV